MPQRQTANLRNRVEGPNAKGNVLEGAITGNETVLDAIARIGGISQTVTPQMWIARPSLDGVGK